MRDRLHRLRGRLGALDRGAATLWYAIVAFGFLIMVGLVVDYGGSLAQKHDAQIAANEAARAAGQAVVEPLGMRGIDVAVNPVGAQGAAQAYLAAAGVQGVVTPIAPQVLRVTTTNVYQPTVLGIIGIGPMTVTGEATVNLNHVGRDGGIPDGSGVVDLVTGIGGGP